VTVGQSRRTWKRWAFIADPGRVPSCSTQPAGGVYAT